MPVPDARLDALDAIVHPKRVVPATVNFVDIAGLVRGASKGEGLGNQFLANIRETDAIAHVVRCFEDDNVIHVDGRVDPVADVETIDTELALADLETVDKRDRARARRRSRAGDKEAKHEPGAAASGCIAHLDGGQAGARAGSPDRGAGASSATSDLLTLKTVFYVANVAEDGSSRAADAHDARARAATREARAPVVVRSARAAEAEIAELDAGGPARVPREPRPQGARASTALSRARPTSCSTCITFLTAGEESAAPGRSSAAPGPRRPPA